MTISITNTTTLGELKKQFSSHFPNLKLVFFQPGTIPAVFSKNARIEDNSLTIGDLSDISSKLQLQIKPGDSVSMLEKQLLSDVGLYAQVFRRSGRIWLETTSTDHWTLEKQNAEGSNEHVEDLKPDPDFESYHEQE